MDKLDMKTKDLTAENITKLKELFPEVVTEEKIDFEKLQLLLGEEVETEKERYDFTWSGKSQAMKLAQLRSTGTLRPCKEESKNWDTTENLYIEGDNLEVLRLLQASYHNKVKMIYIDPPYNTGNDFVYNDDFSDNIANYRKITEQKASNPETSGRYHSDWLNMMYPRLRLARNLLRDDGVIFISIDYNELENLKKISNEVFGEACFKNYIIVRRGIKSVQAQFETISSLTVGHEYVLMYSKNNQTRFPNLYITLDNEKDGSWNNHWRGTDRPTMRYELFSITPKNGQWRWGKERSLVAINNYKKMLSELSIDPAAIRQDQIDSWYTKKIELEGEEIDLLRLSATGKPEHYIPPTDTKLASDLWIDLTTRGSSVTKKLFGNNIFDNPKPIAWIDRMMRFIVEIDRNDIILDFFAGSATTAHAVVQLNAEDGGNRKFIMVQLPEPCDEDSEAYKAGYKNISDIGKERIRRAGEKIKEENKNKEGIDNLDIGFKVFKLDTSNLKVWNPVKEGQLTVDDIKEYVNDFVETLLPERTAEDLMYEIILKYKIELTTPVKEIELAGKKCFDVGEGYLLLCLDKEIDMETIEAICEYRKQLKEEFNTEEMVKRIVFVDEGFKDDNVKINCTQTLKKFGIEDIKVI